MRIFRVFSREAKWLPFFKFNVKGDGVYKRADSQGVSRRENRGERFVHRGDKGQAFPTMTDEYVNQVSDRYIELYESIIGEKFQKANLEDLVSRIEKNVTACLQSLEAPGDIK